MKPWLISITVGFGLCLALAVGPSVGGGEGDAHMGHSLERFAAAFVFSGILVGAVAGFGLDTLMGENRRRLVSVPAAWILCCVTFLVATRLMFGAKTWSMFWVLIAFPAVIGALSFLPALLAKPKKPSPSPEPNSTK